MSPFPLTRSYQTFPIINFLSGKGVPVERYIRRHQLPERMISVAQLWINESRFWALCDDVANREGLPDLGLRVQRSTHLSDLGDFGNSILAQPTLLQAINLFCDLAKSEALGVDYGVVNHNGEMWFVDATQMRPVSNSETVELYNVCLFKSLVDFAVGYDWTPPKVNLRAGKLPDGLQPEDICAGSIQFNSKVTAFQIPVKLFALPMPNHQSVTKGSEPLPFVAEEVDDLTFGTSLRLLMQGYVSEQFGVQDLADLLNVSKRTLQRRLGETGTTFRGLQEQARFELARKLLEQKGAEITEISFELGYANLSGFSRAFKRQAGVSPSDYRNQVT